VLSIMTLQLQTKESQSSFASSATERRIQQTSQPLSAQSTASASIRSITLFTALAVTAPMSAGTKMQELNIELRSHSQERLSAWTKQRKELWSHTQLATTGHVVQRA
jgi:hypothetical protein